MSHWHKFERENVTLDLASCYCDIYINSDDTGRWYLSIPFADIQALHEEIMILKEEK